MEQLSRNEKIAQARKNQKGYKSYKSHNSHNTHKTSTTGKADTIFQSTPLQEKNRETTSFQLRLVAASFLFLAFLGMKEHQLAYQNINYETVLEVISSNSGMEAAEEKIISAFHRLE